MSGRRVRRARALLALGSVAGVALAAPVLAGTGGPAGGGAPSAAQASQEHAPATALVRRTDLVEQEDLDGTLDHGDGHELRVGRAGTVTALPAPGTVLDRGAVVAEVDGEPVTLVLGDRPFWRELRRGVDDGPDVAILEAHLVAIGAATADQLHVDEVFTSATTAAVKRWQASLGVEQTGVVEPGDVVVQPAPVRVAEQLVDLGAQSPGAVLQVTAPDRRVTVALDATRRDLVAVGDAVEVVLPGDAHVPAHVASVGTVVTAGQNGGADTVELVVTLDDQAAAGDLEVAPVDVAVERSRAAGVLAVPVEALLALAEGGYAVERVGAGGATALVGVHLGAFADGLVEVTGDLAEGDAVVVPS